MKRLSICLTLLVVSTIVAWAVLYIEPGREIHLHSDMVARLSNRWHGDRKRWEEHLGRTAYLSQAWKAVDAGNDLWKSKQYTSAMDSWWKTAEEFKDTDAAYASLSNIAMTQHDLGNRRDSMEAMQILLLLPLPKFHDREMAYANYRHDACVKLADFNEQLGNLSFAERFVFQAIHQDTRSDSCANFRWSVNLDLENLLQSIVRRQYK